MTSVLTPLLSPARVHCRADAASRKRLLQTAAQHIAPDEHTEDVLFDELMGRERLGSTALGNGVAIPHCRYDCDAMQVCLLTTTNGIDYEAGDGNLVDIFFVIVVPTDENHAHLQALAELSKIFADPENCRALRACEGDAELHDLMHNLLARDAA